MGRAKSIAKLAVGLLMTVLVLWNIYLGLYQEYSPKKMYKLVLTMIISGECSESSISSDLERDGASDCLEPLGTWGPIDALLLGIGVMLIWKALRSLFSSKRVSNIRRGRGLIRLGTLLTIVAISDFIGMLSGDNEPIQASEMFGIIPPDISLGSILLVIGMSLLIAGVLLRKKGGDLMISKDGSAAGARKFLGPAERHLGQNFSVGDLRRALMLDAFEDPFQVSTDSEMDGMAVGRVCHYCSGSGCDQCGNTGEL